MLTTRVLGRPLRYLPSVASTQEIARAAATAGAAEGLAVVAGCQTAGRGRDGRLWWSPSGGGLYLSLLLRPNLPGDRLAWVTMCLALGTAEAVEAICGLPVDLKWPNDLEVGGRKLAGILSESAFANHRPEFVVGGIGLNVNVEFGDRPDLAAFATSLHAQLGRAVDPNPLLAALLARVEAHYLAMQRGTSPQPAWRARLITLGRTVTATLAPGEVVSGLAADVLPDGALCIRGADGRETVVRAGDVTLMPPRSGQGTSGPARRL